MPLEILEVHFDCAGSQNLVGWRGCLSRLCSRCGGVHIFGHDGHFSWQAQGKPRALNRDFWTCGSFSVIVADAVLC